MKVPDFFLFVKSRDWNLILWSRGPKQILAQIHRSGQNVFLELVPNIFEREAFIYQKHDITSHHPTGPSTTNFTTLSPRPDWKKTAASPIWFVFWSIEQKRWYHYNLARKLLGRRIVVLGRNEEQEKDTENLCIAQLSCGGAFLCLVRMVVSNWLTKAKQFG